MSSLHRGEIYEESKKILAYMQGRYALDPHSVTIFDEESRNNHLGNQTFALTSNVG